MRFTVALPSTSILVIGFPSTKPLTYKALTADAFLPLVYQRRPARDARPNEERLLLHHHRIDSGIQQVKRRPCLYRPMEKVHQSFA
jgi:hypothetical protein